MSIDLGRDMGSGNAHPVANAGPDLSLEVWIPYCVVFDYDACVTENLVCRFGQFAPGHGRFGTGSYDSDGKVVEYRVLWDYENTPYFSFTDPCGSIMYTEPRTHTFRL